MMKKERAHQRQNGQQRSTPSPSQDKAIDSNAILKLGEGGFAFWVDETMASTLKEGAEILCQVQTRDQFDILFKAVVLYSYVYPHLGRIGSCIGVKFVEGHDEIQAILEDIKSSQAKLDRQSAS